VSKSSQNVVKDEDSPVYDAGEPETQEAPTHEPTQEPATATMPATPPEAVLATLVEAVAARVSETVAQRLYIQDAERERQREIWADEAQVRESQRFRNQYSDPPNGGCYKVPIQHPQTGALLGYRFLTGNGDACDPSDQDI
jgi:hypothetical protein